MNNWSSFDTSEVFWWSVAFADTVRSDHLLEWQQIVLTAGERHGVLRVEEAGSIGYRHDRDGPIAAYLADHRDRVPDRGYDHWPRGFFLPALDPAIDPMTRVSSLLDYVDAAGRPARTWVHNLMPLGYEIGLTQYFHQPPLVLDGGYDPATVDSDDTRWIQIGTTVDIWFPWNSPNFHPGRGTELLDNRVLARLNGARLNAFLAEVRTPAVRVGGSWSSPPAHIGHPSADENGAMLDMTIPSRPR
jgi:hypothetical protein